MPLSGAEVPHPVTPHPAERLDSWKEIASFFHRSVSTVQRWEAEEGLPVHRLLHTKAGTVYALTAELEAWYRARDLAGDLERVGTAAIAGSAAAVEGVHRTEEPAVAGGWVTRGVRSRASVLAAALAAAAAVVVWQQTTAPDAHVVRSVAVVTLTDLSPRAERDGFAAGLTETILATLSRSGSFERVIKGGPLTPDEMVSPAKAARRLGAEALLTGAVLRTGTHVRLTVRLVDSQSARRLWSGIYERELSDLMRAQDDLASDLATGVNASAAPRGAGSRERWPRLSPEAYQWYLRGLGALQRFETADLQAALTLFDRSIAVAPEFGAAYAARAIVCFFLPLGGGPMPWSEAIERGMRDSKAALALEEDLAEAHSAAASFAWARHEWTLSERLHRRALELDPGSSLARVLFAHFLVTRGRYEEAVVQARRAVELDPANVFTLGHLAWTYLHARRYTEAVDQWIVTREISSRGDPMVEGMLAMALAGAGRPADAARICDAGRAWPAWCACAYSMSGQLDAAAQIARRMPDGGRGDVEVQSCLGHVDAAVDILEASVATQDQPLLLFVRGPTFYEHLRHDRRFQAMLARLDLPR
jgi:TolB-like protein